MRSVLPASKPGGRSAAGGRGEAVMQIGGRWNQQTGRVERPFLGVMSGLFYNSHRPLGRRLSLVNVALLFF
jgi:hypothetical protein